MDYEKLRSKSYVDKLALNRNLSSCMNNAKWVKVLEHLVFRIELIENIKIKLLWDETIRNFNLDKNSSRNFNFYHNAIEGLISGAPSGLYNYFEIELLYINVQQKNVPILLDGINSIGMFETAITASGIVFYAYK